MGANSRRRRAGRRRPRPDERVRWDGPDARSRVAAELGTAVYRLTSQRRDLAADQGVVGAALRRLTPVPPVLVAEAAGELVSGVLGPVTAGGWAPGDLVELVRRNADPRHVPALLTALHDEVRRRDDRGADWQAALAAHGPDPRRRLLSTAALTSALVVTAVLIQAPLLTADALDVAGTGATAPDTAPVHPKLARVRALLAKAESTDFPQEAETLTAKAQELIARYSLDQLVARGPTGAGHADLVTRRIWLDAPYVRAKAALVHAVGSANHVRTAVSDRLGFVIAVGTPGDVEAVELLVTSLLVQADRAMLSLGRRADRAGSSRTRSFRRSFLLAFAARIGERLTRVSRAAVARDAGDLLPVLRSHQEQVDAAFDTLVPHTVGRTRAVSSGEGWAAGVAAADVAQLGVRAEVGEAG